MSDGGACWQFYQEIRGYQEALERERSESKTYRGLLETWLKRSVGDEKFLLLKRSVHYPWISPDMVEQCLDEVTPDA